MAATDIVQKLDEGLVAIVTADATMRALCGRTTALMVPWQDVGEATLPVVVYQLVTMEQGGGLGDERRGVYTFTAFSEGKNARANAHALMERMEQVLTYSALTAQGLNAAALTWTRRGIAENVFEDTRNVRRADGDLTIWITK